MTTLPQNVLYFDTRRLTDNGKVYTAVQCSINKYKITADFIAYGLDNGRVYVSKNRYNDMLGLMPVEVFELIVAYHQISKELNAD